MRCTDEIVRKLKEPSKDKIVFNSIIELNNFLLSENIKFLTIGSCAVLSHSDFISRIPNDIDIAISQKNFVKIENKFKGKYDLTARTGFYEFKINKLKGHIVVDTLNIIDFFNKKVFTSISLNLPDGLRTKRKINTTITNTSLRITVPVKEVCIVLNLIGPLDTNIFRDTLSLLEDEIILSNITQFIDLQEDRQIVSSIIEERLAQLLSILQRTAMPHKAKIRSNIFSIMDTII